MNYFSFHIGDYICATQHLSLEEDLMFRRLLDLYYTTEKPLTKDELQLFRLTRANCELNQDAVRAVLLEFFQETELGWVNKRAEAELKVMCDLRDDKQARKLNEKERMRRHREKRAHMFEALRAIEVVPAWDISLDELEVLYQSRCVKDKQNLQREQVIPVTHLQRVLNATATAIPIPIPIPINKRKSASAQTEIQAVAAPDGVLLSVWEDFCKHRREKKARLTPTALAGIQREAALAGWSLNDALAECCTRGWIGFKAEWALPKPKFGDIVHTTVPSSSRPDPALEKIRLDRLKAVPMPAHVRAQIDDLFKRSGR